MITRSRRSLKLLFFLGTVLLILLGFQVALNLILRQQLRALFARETKCEVEMGAARTNLLQSFGVADGVRIHCAGTPAEDEVVIGQVSVIIDLPALLQQRVKLDELLLQDARVNRTGEQAAFHALWDFLFEPPKQKTNNWDVQVGKVTIQFRANATDPLSNGIVFAQNGSALQAKQADLVIERFVPGQKFPWILSLSGTDLELVSPGRPVVALGGLVSAMRIEDGVLEIDHLALTGNAEDHSSVPELRLRVNGDIPFGDLVPMNFNVSLSASGPFLLTAVPELRAIPPVLRPALVFDGTLSGGLSTLELAGHTTLAVEPPSLPAIGGCEVRTLASDVHLSTERLTLRTVIPDDLPVSANASLDLRSGFPFSGNIHVEHGALDNPQQKCFPKLFSELLRLVNVKANVAAEGTLIPFSYRGTIAAEAESENEYISQLTAEGEFSESGVTISTAKLRKGSLVLLSARGTWNATGPVEAELTAKDLDLVKLLPGVPGLVPFAPKLSVVGSVSGTVESPLVDLKGMTEFSHAESYYPAEQNTFTGKLSKTNFEFHASALNAAAEAVVRCTAPASESIRFDDFLCTSTVTTHQLPLASNAVRSAQGTMQLSTLSLDALLDYHFPMTKPMGGNGILSISRLEQTGAPAYIAPEHPARMKLTPGLIAFSDVAIKASTLEVRLLGDLDFAKGWNSRINGRWPISQILPVATGLEHASGTVSVSVGLSGPMATPEMQGSVVLEDATLTFPFADTVLGLEDVHLKATLSRNVLSLDSFSGTLGDGTLNGNGRIVNIFSHPTGKVTLRLRGASLEPYDSLLVNLGGQISLEKELDKPFLVQGNIEIQNAIYENEIDLPRILQSITSWISRPRELPTISRTRHTSVSDEITRAEIDLTIHADQSLAVETSFAETESKADLRLFGRLDQPTLSGDISIINGWFGFQANRFDVTSGTIRFDEQIGSIDPLLNIVGESVVRSAQRDEILVTMSITGRVSKPLVSLRSDSGLSDSQLASLIGQGGGIGTISLLKHSESQRSVVDLVNPRSDVSLAERLTGLTGFTDVQVGSTTLPRTGQAVTTLTAKRQLFREAEVQAFTELSETQLGEIIATYPLSPTLNFFGGWRTLPLTQDQNTNTGTFTGGVQYRNTYPGTSLIPPLMTEIVDHQ